MLEQDESIRRARKFCVAAIADIAAANARYQDDLKNGRRCVHGPKPPHLCRVCCPYNFTDPGV